MIGERFGKLVILEEANEKWIKKFLCQCDCGNLKIIAKGSLVGGRSNSCGCMQGAVKHNLYKTKEYYTWGAMIQRCTNPNNPKYLEYGDRGITVCDRWLYSQGGSFENFLEDMGEAPDGMTLERIDVNGNYCKENCRWDTRSAQQFNRRISKYNTSGRTGVRLDKRTGKWVVSIKKRHVGCFEEFEDAVKAREAAELEEYGFIKEQFIGEES